MLITTQVFFFSFFCESLIQLDLVCMSGGSQQIEASLLQGCGCVHPLLSSLVSRKSYENVLKKVMNNSRRGFYLNVIRHSANSTIQGA